MRKIITIFIILLLASITVSPHGLKAQEGASIYITPVTGTFIVGSTFDVSIFVNTGGASINAIKVDLKFSPLKIQVVNPTIGKSFVSVWISQPSYSNVDGIVSFQGGLPNPGVNTSSGLVSTLTFRAIAPGTGTVSVMDDSHIFLNDGKGTDILNSTGRGAYDIVLPPPAGPEVVSPTNPNEYNWYKNNSPTFSWRKEGGITDFSYSIDKDYLEVPDNISEGDNDSISYENLEDGFWYFHIKAKKNGVWGGVSTYVAKIDTTPPAEFTLSIESNLASIISAGSPIVNFVTTDALSGIDHYEIKTIPLDKANVTDNVGFFVETSSPYRPPLNEPGMNKIVVRAFDKAGNWRDASATIRILPYGKFIINREGVNFWVIFLRWWVIALIIVVPLLIILVILFLRKKIRKSQREKIQENGNKTIGQ